MIDINARDDHGETAFTTSVSMGHIDVVKYLLDNGADVNLVGPYGMSPLEYACRLKETKIVKLLLDYNAVVDSKTGVTALMISSAHGDYETVKVLLEYGADANKVSDKKMTALIYAKNHLKEPLVEIKKSGDYKKIIYLLKKYGAK